MLLVAVRVLNTAVCRTSADFKKRRDFTPSFCAARVVLTLQTEVSSGCESSLCTFPSSSLPHAQHQLLRSTWQEKCSVPWEAQEKCCPPTNFGIRLCTYSACQVARPCFLLLDGCTLLELRERRHAEIL